MAEGSASRRLAIEAMIRIENGGAYANLLVPDLLAKSDLSPEDRRFVTQLVYGTTRMKRACDYLVDRFVLSDTDDQVRAALRIGAYQLYYLRTPPHAAVNATVEATIGKGGSLVNAVLRRVSEASVTFPDLATELSYPDWIVDRFTEDLGADDAAEALAAMNEPAATVERADGYIQDPASQGVVEAMGATSGERIYDLCAAPGGKATGLAASGALVIAADRRKSRTRLIAANAERLGVDMPILVADGLAPPVRAGSVDRVLVDAPCSGFGSFRRRADARWRIEPEAPQRLQELQVGLVRAGLDLLGPGGTLTYSVCTLTKTEGVEVAEQVLADGNAELLPTLGLPWLPQAEGVGYLLPIESDGMTLFQLRRR